MHYRYGGSTAARTMACSAWVALSQRYTSSGVNHDAVRGTHLHNCMELIYTDSKEPEHFLGEKYVEEELSHTIDSDSVKQLEIALNATEMALDEIGVGVDQELLCEETLTYPMFEEDIGGTADMLVVSEQLLMILDYKFGYVAVTPDSDQFYFYAWLAIANNDKVKGDAKVAMVVIQPAADDAPQIHYTTVSDVLDWADKFIAAVEQAEDGNQQPTKGEHCKFCPHKVDCVEHQLPKELGTTFNVTKSNTEVATGALLTLSQKMALIPQLKKFIKTTEKAALAELEQGKEVKGYKLVAKRGRRVWSNEEVLRETLKNKRKIKKSFYLTEQLESPAQLEKTLKDNLIDFDLSDHYESVSSGNTLACVDDKRAEINLVQDNSALAVALGLK